MTPSPRWHGSPLDDRNRNTFLDAGVPFCTIGDPHKKEAVLIIDQSEIEFVRTGYTALLKLDAFPEITYKCRIEGTVTNVKYRTPLAKSLTWPVVTSPQPRMQPGA